MKASVKRIYTLGIKRRVTHVLGKKVVQ